MSDLRPAVVVPMRFAGVDLLVEASPVTVVGSEPTSAADRLADAYERVEAAITKVAESVAHTVGQLASRPKEMEVEFGLSLPVEGDIVLAKGTAEATLAVRLTGPSSSSCPGRVSRDTSPRSSSWGRSC